MKDADKSKGELLEEIARLGKQLENLKSLEKKCQEAKEAIDQNHKQLLSIFEGIDHPVYVVCPDTYEILYVNQAIKSIMGEVVGKKCYEAFQALEFPCSFCTNKYIFGDNLGKSYIWDFQNRFNKRWYHCIDKAIRWPDGRMVRLEVAIDITDRKRAEVALHTSNTLLERALYNLHDAVFIFDTKLESILDSNPAASKVFGYSRDELLGADPSTLYVSKDEFESFKKSLYSAIKTEGFLSKFHFNMKCKDGTIFASSQDAMFLEDDKGNPLCLAYRVRDVNTET